MAPILAALLLALACGARAEEPPVFAIRGARIVPVASLFFADAGWTCHCDACTKAFREYLQKRFGNAHAAKLRHGDRSRDPTEMVEDRP